MASEISREEALRLLDFMGIHYTLDTKLTSDTVAEKLTKAIDLAQRVPHLLSKRINPNSLEAWTVVSSSSTSPRRPLLDVFRQSSMEECAQHWFREQIMGNPNVPLYIDAFSDVRQSLMSIVLNYMSPDRSSIFLLEDKEQSHSITIRLLGDHVLNDDTPLLSVLYEHGPGSGLRRARDFLTQAEALPKITATVLEQKLLIKVLEQNSKRVAPSFKPQRHYSERMYTRSFILPLLSLSMENIGTLTKSGCVLCGVPAVSRCSPCQSVAYCGKECQAADWKEHKKLCKPLSSGTWQKVRFSLPTSDSGESLNAFIINRHSMPREIMKQVPLKLDGVPPPNVHGTTPFIVKIQVPVAGKCYGIMVYDRRRSFTGYITRSTDPAAYARVEEIVRRKGIWGIKMYRWAKMVADWTLDICLDAEPKEPVQW